MKAVTMRAHGGPEVLQLEDLPDPEAGPGQVLVRIRAVALNHLDVWVRQGWPGLVLAWPHVPGSDVAGVVEAVGAGVAGVGAGDEVVLNPGVSCGRCEMCLAGLDNGCRRYAILGEHVSGGYAERLAVPAANVLPKPENLSFDEAACLPLVFLTAWHALVSRAQLKAGETVLVQAAGSGVGSAAVQIAKLLGATVIATAGSDDKCRKALGLGADHAVNYETEDFLARAKALTGKRGVDVVFEHVGKKTWEKSILCLVSGGRLVTVGATTGWDPLTDLRHVFYRQLSVLGSTMGSKGELFQVLKFVERGKLRPVLDRVLPLAEAARAQQLLASRAQFGKIVLNP
ncbi:MAG TPA: zinc-binding dehydrogenase [Anaeromyxobacteraceae bacterium]|nr:zinc-binding dehydrogenase [Anaeromyxobacteraceae bacterium]